MSKTTVDALALKVHVGEGGVWAVDGEGQSKRVAGSAAEFMESPLLASATCIRLIGTHHNASLIVALYERKLAGKLESIQLASPLVCLTRAERRDPTVVLYRMHQYRQAPSMGGFHEMTLADLAAYALTAEVFHDGAYVVTSRAVELFQQHPVCKPLLFLPTLNQLCCIQLLAYIIDPRWFIDPVSPDSNGRLNASLGLNVRTQTGVTRGRKSWARNTLCTLALRAWKDPAVEGQVVLAFNEYGPVPDAKLNTPGLRPGDFPWRVWGSLCGYGPTAHYPHKSAVIADLRASQVFVAFLRHTWLAEIYRGAILPDQSASLFRSKDFFRRYLVESTAYEHHMRGGCASV